MTARPDVLRGAADMIRTGGLAQEQYVTAGGAHCTVGALVATVSGTNSCLGVGLDDVMPETELLSELLDVGGVGLIFSWNDDPKRTADEVITLLEQAAEKAEADQ